MTKYESRKTVAQDRSLGTLIGPLMGAGFVHLLINHLIEFTERYLLIVGLIFIIIILLAPRGIVGTVRENWRATSEGKPT